jgi:hypothetical protein
MSKIMLWKRNGMPDFDAIFGVRKSRKSRTFDGYPMSGMRKNDWDFSVAPIDGSGGSAHEPEPADETENLSNDANADDRNADDEPLTDNDGASPTGAATRHVSELADLLVTAAKGQIDKGDAIHWLLFTQRGRTALARTHYMHKRKEQTTMRSHSELMSDVVKKYGIVAFCKSVEKGDVAVSEHQLTSLISEHCARTGVSFSKLFEAQDEQGITLRKAIAAARDAQFLSKTATAATLQPVSLKPRVSGFSGKPAQQNVNDPKTALSQLGELVAAMRAANPDLTEAQAFATVLQTRPTPTLPRAREWKIGRLRRGE